MGSEAFVARGPEGFVNVVNEPLPIRAWVKTTPPDAIIALESTGGYGVALAEIAHAMGRKVFVLTPRQIAAHRRIVMRRAKTDRLDAELIRDLIKGAHTKLHPFEPWGEPWKTLRNLVRIRTRIAKDKARMSLRLKSLGVSAKDIAQATAGVKNLMVRLEKQIAEILKSIPQSSAVRSPKGIGLLATAAAIAVLGQVPFKDKHAFVAYMGMDLIVRDSGKFHNRRSISSWGDETLRNLFYLAGMTAARCPEWQPYVMELKARGMKPKEIHCAIARRLARIVFALYHSQEQFDPTRTFRRPKPTHPGIAMQT